MKSPLRLADTTMGRAAAKDLNDVSAVDWF